MIQALRRLGRQHVDDRVVALLQRKLPATEEKILLRDAKYAPAWVADVLRQVAREDHR